MTPEHAIRIRTTLERLADVPPDQQVEYVWNQLMRPMQERVDHMSREYDILADALQQLRNARRLTEENLLAEYGRSYAALTREQ